MASFGGGGGEFGKSLSADVIRYVVHFAGRSPFFESAIREHNARVRLPRLPDYEMPVEEEASAEDLLFAVLEAEMSPARVARLRAIVDRIKRESYDEGYSQGASDNY